MGGFAKYAAYMLKGGYSPVPCIGKRPVMDKWDHLRAKAMTVEEIAALNRKHANLNLGVAGGFDCLIPVDLDMDDRNMLEAVLKVLPPVMVAKSGRRGLTSFYWDSSGMIEGLKIKRPKPGGFEMLVEVLATGQSVIPPSVHPDTRRQYVWRTRATLFNTRVDDLPEIDPDHITAMRKALEPWLPKPEAYKPRVVAEGTPQTSDRRLTAYARAILSNEVRQLASMPKDSGRNSSLFHAFCKLGWYIHHGIISEVEAEKALMLACERNGLWQERDAEPKGCKATFKSGLRWSQNDPRPVLGERRRAA